MSPFCRWIFCYTDAFSIGQQLGIIINYYYTYSNNKINVNAVVCKEFLPVLHGR